MQRQAERWVKFRDVRGGNGRRRSNLLAFAPSGRTSMFQRAHRTILIFLAVAGLAAACSGGSSASPPEPTDSTVASTAGGTVATNGTASPATTPVPVGMRMVAADRFSIVVPDDWRALLLDESGTITPDRADDPAPAQPLEQLALATALQGG